MKISDSIIVAIVATVLSSLWVSIALPANPPKPSADAAASAAASPETAKARKAWQQAIARVPVPKKGCFKAVFPKKKWQEVPCGPPSKYPNPPTAGPRSNTVGSTSGDVSAVVSPLLISKAVGSFDSVTPANVTESGPFQGNTLANAFTLQLNTQFFTNNSQGCNAIAGCQEWEQFLFSQNQCKQAGNNAPCVFIEYWLLGFGNCPAGWTAPSGSTWTNGLQNCFINSNNTIAPAVTAAQLQTTTLSGTAAAGTDTVVLTTAGGIATAFSAPTSLLNLVNNWNTAEFNVVGDCCNSLASFSNGAKIDVRVSLTDASGKKPACLNQSFTAETNNLSFGPTAPAVSGTAPAILFEESGAGGLAACAAATSVGDTHLATFGNTLYDFQASGDFVLAESANPVFIVQARQQSGAPTWPNATVNKAVAARVGNSTVAVCLPPSGLAIDGKRTEVQDGKVLELPGGGGVLRNGNAYLISDNSGNWLRADVIDPYINVSVGLGRWPSSVRGVLGNVIGKANEIASRDGVVLRAPFPFVDLYHHYADSWRVPAGESMLSACGEAKSEPGLPKTAFYAANLDRALYESARATCTAAGVRANALLDACTLDVAVIGTDAAAKVYVGLRAPAVNGNPGKGRHGHGDDHDQDRDR